MTRFTAVMLALAALAPSAACAQLVDATSEDYAVYRAAVSALLARSSSAGLPDGVTVVAARTQPLLAEETFRLIPPRLMADIDPGTVEGVRAVEGQGGRVAADSLALPGAFRELAPQADDSMFVEPKDIFVSWRRFHERFGTDAVRLTVSRVGFNRDHTQAVVHVRRMCDGLCGYGETLLMQKQDGRWSVQRAISVTRN